MFRTCSLLIQLGTANPIELKNAEMQTYRWNIGESSFHFISSIIFGQYKISIIHIIPSLTCPLQYGKMGFKQIDIHCIHVHEMWCLTLLARINKICLSVFFSYPKHIFFYQIFCLVRRLHRVDVTTYASFCLFKKHSIDPIHHIYVFTVLCIFHLSGQYKSRSNVEKEISPQQLWHI